MLTNIAAMAKTQLLAAFAPWVMVSKAMAARVTDPKKVPKNAILLSKVKSLTFRAGEKTASRRVSPVAQLECVGPADVCKLYQVDIMRCANEGSDYEEENIQWACRASLPEEFKLGSTDVSCEGYQSSEDPYVLKGSCGVEYRLLLTDKGEEKYRKKHETPLRNSGFQKSDSSKSYASKSDDFAGYVFMAIFLAVLFIILRSMYMSWRDERRRPGGRRLGNGGGGRGGGPPPPPPPPPPNDDHPPPYEPYDYRTSSAPKKPRTSSNRSYSTKASSSGSAGTHENEGWRPGFWTGAAAGAAAAAAYGAANRPQQPQNQHQQPIPQQQAPPRSSWGGLFGGRSSEPRARPSSPPPQPPPQPQQPMQQRNSGWLFGGQDNNPPAQTHAQSTETTRSSPPTYSTTRHESTGFGSTKRR